VDNKKLRTSDVERLASLALNDAAPLSFEDVFAKTELALTELKRRDSTLPQRLKTVLMLIDGRTPYGSFARSLRAYEPVDELFILLRDTGYIVRTGKTKFFAAATPQQVETASLPSANVRAQPALSPSGLTGSSLLTKRQSVAEILGDPAHWELPVFPQTPTSGAQAASVRQAPMPPAAPRPPAAATTTALPPTPPTAVPAARPVQALSVTAPARVAMPAAVTPKAASAAATSLQPFITQDAPRSLARQPATTVDVGAMKSLTLPSSAQSRALKLSADLLCDALSTHAGFDGMEVMLALERCVLVEDLTVLLPKAAALLEPAMGQAPLHALMQRIDATLAA
jgi:hypothetical protein